MANRVSLAAQVRMLGLRRGFRTWRRFSEVQADPERLPEVRIHHGKRPDMTGYRRTKS